MVPKTPAQIETAVTEKEVKDILSSQFQMNFVPTPQGMQIQITQGPFLTQVIMIPAHAMTQAAKAWAHYCKQQAEAQRDIERIKASRVLH